MKRIALIRSGAVASVASWDGVSAWDPVAAGLCDSTVDVGDRPEVGPGWAFAGGTFTAPTPTITPDPRGFLLAVFGDGSIPIATRLALAPWETAIAHNLDSPAVIAGAWQALAAQYAISPPNQATIHAYALAFGVPGI